MKILFYLESLEKGGAERVTTNLANFFSCKNEVFVVTKKAGENEYQLNDKVSRAVKTKCHELRQYLLEIKPNIVIVMFAPSSIRMTMAKIGLNIPIIISERNDPNNFGGKKITKYIYQACMKLADGLVFQTKDAMKYYDFCKKPEKQIIYNPLDLNMFENIRREQVKNKIVTVGRLHKQKNQKLLIDAFKQIHIKYSDYYLEIYGDGNLKLDLINYIEKNNLADCIFLKGEKSNVWQLIQDAKLFVLSSDYEGLPNALIEAMALGIPCVSTDCPCGGPKELIIDHYNGSLVPTNDVKTLSYAIEELLSNNDLMRKYSNNSIEIRKKVGNDEIYKQWYYFIEKVIDKYYVQI